MYAIETQHIGKTYRSGVEALKDISIKVKQGEIYCLLGENGAGKSTLINILSTFFQPSKGNIKLFNEPLTDKNINIFRKKIATVSQQISVDTYLTLKENMLFQAELYNIPKDQALQRMTCLINDFGLEKYLNYPVSSFSGGIKRRLDIALNLMSNPRLLFLDEPTVGMDVQSRQEMWKMIKHIKEEMHTTIFLTTHYLEEAEQLSDSICIMRNGQILIQESTAAIRDYFHENMIEIKFTSPKDASTNYATLQSNLHDFCHSLILKGDSIFILNHTEYDITFFMKWILKHDIHMIGISTVYPTLEDVFVRIVGKDDIS